jgi:alkylation response protein AidB-like acyl-CoA dehydrogenase
MQFTEDQIAFRDTLKRFIAKEVAPIADEVDRNDRFPAELVPKFGDMGLLQLRLPESYGGPGANLTTVCIAAEEFAKVSESIALISGQNGIAMIVPLMQCRELKSFVYERTTALRQ